MERYNVVIIVLDTLREDHSGPIEGVLSKWGFKRLERVVSPSPWTAPSHASLLTGTYPAFHGVHVTRRKRFTDFALNDRIKPITLQEILKRHGYRTHLLSANAYVSTSFGYDNHDRTYEARGTFARMMTPSLAEAELLKGLRGRTSLETAINLLAHREIRLLAKLSIRKLSIVFGDALYPIKYLRAASQGWPKEKGISKFASILREEEIRGPAYVFLNLMEVHEPYVISRGKDPFLVDTVRNLKDGVLPEDRARLWRRKYGEHVEYLSKKLKGLLEALDHRLRLDDSLVVVTSDHGQLLGEHGRLNHGIFLFEELLRVPLFVRYPRGSDFREAAPDGGRRANLVGLKRFILDGLRKGELDENKLYSTVSFAEVYGIHLRIEEELSRVQRENLERLDRYRIAAYFDGYKATMDVRGGQLEIESLEGRPVTEIEREKARRIILTFLEKRGGGLRPLYYSW